MKNKILCIIICISLFSCKYIKNNNSENINNTSVEMSLIFNEEQINNLFLYLKNRIDGYYTSLGMFSNEDTTFLSFIYIDKNELVINKYNIVNNQEIFDELIKINHNLMNSPDLLWNNEEIILEYYNYKLIIYREAIIRMILSDINANKDMENIGFTLLSRQKDELLLKHTYDYQKKYTGIYEYDSHTVFGISMDEFSQKFELLNKIIININNNGFLNIANEIGESLYNIFDFKIFNENEKTYILNHYPSYGSNTFIYIYENNIYFGSNFGNNWFNENGEEEWDAGYQIIYNKK